MFGYMTLQIYIILEGFHVKLGVDRGTWGSSQEIYRNTFPMLILKTDPSYLGKYAHHYFTIHSPRL